MDDLDTGLGVGPTGEPANNLSTHQISLSQEIRNALTRLDMLIYLDKKKDAHEEIQELSRYLDSHGL